VTVRVRLWDTIKFLAVLIGDVKDEAVGGTGAHGAHEGDSPKLAGQGRLRDLEQRDGRQGQQGDA